MIAEQFTDNFTPQGIIAIPQEILKLLKEIIPQISESETYMYLIPNPVKGDRILSNQVKFPHPFQLIKKRDYVVTFQNNYSSVISESEFRGIYLEDDPHLALIHINHWMASNQIINNTISDNYYTQY